MIRKSELDRRIQEDNRPRQQEDDNSSKGTTAAAIQPSTVAREVTLPAEQKVKKFDPKKCKW
jgi:hypothetical protein